MAFLKANANYMQKKLHIRDGCFMHVFVRHEGFDSSGVELAKDGSFFPGERQKKKEEEAKNYSTSPFDKRGDVADAGLQSSSSDSEYDEQIDYNNDAEEKVAVHTHRFTIDLVARYPDVSDDLVLHWGLSRKKEGAWGTPDPAFHPVGTRTWHDGLACQTTF